MKISLSLILLLTSLQALAQIGPDMNIIYGTHHIFTIATPQGWVNDKELAASVGLVSFFYPESSSGKEIQTFMYAMGYDKDEHNKNVKSFVEGDIARFKEKYPKMTYDKVKIKKSDGILDARMLSFSNFGETYKEEVVYLEAEHSIIVLVFTAASEPDYSEYQIAFEQFVNSFQYRGSDPKPILEWLNGQHSR